MIQVPKIDQYYIVYHRRPLDDTDGNHRVTCIDEMSFDKDGKIKSGEDYEGRGKVEGFEKNWNF